tara:strand:+ start:1515 stop:2390 length:876 start_codon:yes stop_codon:yes gene_type:complete
MRINKNDKILFIVSDYGSRNIILSLIKINKLKKYQIYDLKKINNKKIYNTNYDFIIIGSGIFDFKKINFIKKINSKNTKIYLILDHWLGFKQRTKFNKYFKKNISHILVSDIQVNKKLKKNLGFKNIKKIKNYFIHDQINKSKSIKINKKFDFLYIDDPGSYCENINDRKKILNISFKNLLEVLDVYYKKSKKKIKLLIRPHPSQRSLELFKKNIRLKLNNSKYEIKFSRKGDLLEEIIKSKYIFGMQSSALILSQKLKKKTYCCVPKKFLNRYSKLNLVRKQHTDFLREI